MIVTLSAVALFGILTALLIRSRHVGPLAAIVLFLFGFFTADTGAADTVRATFHAIADAAQHLT